MFDAVPINKIKTEEIKIMKIEFTADMRTFDAKPNQQEAARISGSLKPVYVESVEEFVEDMQHGRT
ncbi:MAG: hypothetical protein JJ958_12040 [Balneola sp.]|nr:hypothetical protein [Balneola sp.]